MLLKHLFATAALTLLNLHHTVIEGSVTPTKDHNAVAAQSVPLSQAVLMDEERDGPLIEDIALLTDILDDIVNREDATCHDLFQTFLKYGTQRSENVSDSGPLQEMVKLAASISSAEALSVMRSFATALNLINAAEVTHRMRLVRAYELVEDDDAEVGPLPLTEDSVRGTIKVILEQDGVSKKDIYNQLLSQSCEIVLTAHPTEVNRRTLLKKYRRISESLTALSRPDLHPFERSEKIDTLKRLVAAIWGCDEIRRSKPTPQEEALGGVAVLESILWDAVPLYLRKLDAQVQMSLNCKLPPDYVPVRFASWIGGDRDGNPNVTPAVTKEVINNQRLRAAKLYLNNLYDLYGELAISSKFSDKMMDLAGSVKKSRDKKELYRRVIGHLQQRFVKTIKECENSLEIDHRSAGAIETSKYESHNAHQLSHLENIQVISKSEDLLIPLMIMYDSLVETGFEAVADGLLVDTIRRVKAFGMTLVPLDIREESTRHTLALDAITQHLGLGSYKEWDEQARLNFLQSELTSKRPLFQIRDMASFGFDSNVLKTLRVFETAAQQQSEALGAYVISQAQTASDVLAVMLLQKQFGMTAGNGKMMRVVPLFETLDDLTNAPDVLSTLFSMPAYTGSINGKQEVMVGYSDSAKDAGRIAAAWVLYESQEKMSAVATESNIELTFFHGKGGTVGRGGNPALYRAILAHPPNTINGRFRVTEQGEMITQNFGSPAIAQRTLDIYTSAILREHFYKHVEPRNEWREEMARISKISCDGYRSLVRGEPRFVPYFRKATPELELRTLNIGSRPAKRSPHGGIETLRAIPWTFAWTQTRTNLSAWLGVGDAFSGQTAENIAVLRDMYENWPWFRESVDLVGMILSKTDYSISKNYDTQLVDSGDAELKSLGKEIRRKMVAARQGYIDVTQKRESQGVHVQLLRASTKVRSPYLDPINVIQAEILKRLRTLEGDDSVLSEGEMETKQQLKDALFVSINGIAQGMRNSG